MSSKRTARHFFFCILLRRYGPSAFEIRDEIPLSEKPPRMDYLLLRRAEDAQPAAPAQTLLALSGGLFALFVVEIDAVAEQPDEDLLALYYR